MPIPPLESEWFAEFPILQELDFFNHAGVAPVSRRAAVRLREFADRLARRAMTEPGAYDDAERLRSSAARLIRARGPDEIALIPNTSSGLSLVARGLSWKPGDEVVITNVEYPANRYPWEDLQRLGVRLVEVAQHPDGRIDPEDVCEAVTDRTRCVALSHVQYASGHRLDLKPIADLAHRAGAFLCVDGIQSCGVTPVDVRAMGVDFLAADGHKWLLGPEGAGFFYARRDLVELLHPAIVGWKSVVNATDFGRYRFELRPDARRFEPGTLNVAGLAALDASLSLLLEVGIDRVWARVFALTQRLVDGLESIGWRVFSPRRDEAEASGIVIFDPPSSVKAKRDPQAIVRMLRREGIVLVVREGRLRASPHFYNTTEQIDRLIATLDRAANEV